jgi:DNA polymerase III subunit delta
VEQNSKSFFLPKTTNLSYLCATIKYEMTYKEVLQVLKKREFRPVYLLHGEESYYIDALSSYFEDKILNEGEKSFNFTVLYGKDTEFKEVVDNARRYPMMSEYQVVIVKEAQDMKTLPELLTYMEKPTPTTILVLCHKHKKLDTRTKFGKAVMQHAFVFESAKLYDNQIPDWIVGSLKEHQLTIKPEAANLLAEYLGTDLSKIVNELEKLSLNLPKGTLVTNEHIEKYVGISKEYNIFELTRALSIRDISKCNKIVHHLNENTKKNPFIMTLSTLYSFFSKVYMLHYLQGKPAADQVKTMGLRSEWALKEYVAATKVFSIQKTEFIIGFLKEYDMRAKGVGNISTSDEDLLVELMYKILH